MEKIEGIEKIDMKSRDKIIVRTSVIGIIANIFLSAFKAVVGLMTHSIAITLDAVNNISDAASSVITIVGTKLAGRAPDKKHPFGYGRIEYLSAMVISLIILYAGITSFVESIKKIITPEIPDYTPIALIIVAVGVVVKVFLGRYVKRVGEQVDSDSLVNSGADATLDSIISASTLVAAGIYMIWGLSLEAYLGAIISIIIVKSGVDMIKETLADILGQSADPAFAMAIKATIRSFPDVEGAYDLVIHDYGPNMHHGSVHIEVRDDYPVVKLDELTREIYDAVYEEHHVILTGVSVYAQNTTDPVVAGMKLRVAEIALGIEYINQVHGFYLNKEKKNARFDIVVSLACKDREALMDEVLKRLAREYPEHSFDIKIDTDFAEI